MKSLSRSCALFLAALVLVAATPSAMAYYCENGQLPAPPALAARMALPLCGFDATKRWGPNGCQLCDPRNIYPRPYSGAEPPHRWHRYRAYE